MSIKFLLLLMLTRFQLVHQKHYGPSLSPPLELQLTTPADKLTSTKHLYYNSSTIEIDRQPYCSFFNNRAPSTQINLRNCTWYKENSCCLQSEIESTFSKVKPLIGSSPLCQRYLNKLMCYICSPKQHKFYGKERLTVCVEFCTEMYNACAEAVLKGSKINEIYLNGVEFCKSRRFNIDYKMNDNCFYYDVFDEFSENYIKNSVNSIKLNKLLILLSLNIILIKFVSIKYVIS